MSKVFDKDMHWRNIVGILSEINKVVSEKTALKGGTCAMLFYDLPRFSFDLDIDILRPFTNTETDAVRTAVSGHGNILDEKDKEYTLFFLLSYAKGHHKIKVEMNKRIWKNNVYTNNWFMGLPLNIQNESTVFTNKLVALSNRKNPVARDLFDVWFFLSKRFPIADGLIEERTGKTTFEYMKSLGPFIKKIYTKKNVLQGLGEALDEKQKIWVREHLIDTVVEMIGRRMIEVKKKT